MDYRLIDERTSGSGPVGAIERIYRCNTNFGAIVYQMPPGSEGFDRLLVTPIRFTGPNSEDYMILHEGTATEGLESGELLRPKFLYSDDDVETLLGKLCALGENKGEGESPQAAPRQPAAPVSTQASNVKVFDENVSSQEAVREMREPDA